MKNRIHNKEKQKIWSNEHYLKNKEKIIQKAKINNKLATKRNREYIKDYLSKNPCVDCGNDNLIVLEFDHISNNKKYNISDMVKGAYSLKTIKEEISKCQVRCANCHRIVTYNRKKQIESDALTN